MDETSTTGMELLVRLAQRQGGCVALWQASALGISRKVLRRRVHREGWRVIHRCVLRLPGARDDDFADMWAALLAVADLSAPGRVAGGGSVRDLGAAVGGAAAVTAWSAARVHGFERHRPTAPQLLVPHSTQTRRTGMRLVRSRRTIADHWEWRDGLPLARPFRLMWDAAHLANSAPHPVTTLADLAVMLDRRRIMGIDVLLLMAEEPAQFGLPRRKPKALSAAAKLLRPGFSHSGVEARGREIALEVGGRLGVEMTPRPHPVIGPDGGTIAEVDIAIPALKIAVEIDGPHHDEPSAQRYDRRRDARLRAQGWIVLRYSAERVDADPEAFREQLQRDLTEAMVSAARTAS